MAYWLFQGNPKYYRIIDAIRDQAQMPWLVTRYAQQMTVGDGVLIWQAGAEAGIYAIAELAELPKFWDQQPDKQYWLDKTKIGGRPQALIRFTQKLTESPLLRSQLRNDPILKDLLVIRAPNSTNFKVTPEQWQHVVTLASGR